MKESAVTSHVRLAAAERGIDLWRNNVGVLKDATGRPVRFGLLNDSKQMNERLKSSDWIGITPVVITPEMMGRTLGVFTAMEMKEEGWIYDPRDARAVAQAAFHALVQRAGGLAGFASSVRDFLKIVGKR